MTAVLLLTTAAGCSSGTSDTRSEGAEPSASFTEKQLIRAFTSQGYSVTQNDPELDIESKTVSIVELEFQREQNGLTDSGGLLYIEFSDAKFCTELYQQYMRELAEDGIVPNTKSGNDWDYAYQITENNPEEYRFQGYIYYRNKKECFLTKKVLTIFIALCMLLVFSACTAESTAIAGTYIPYQAYQVDEAGRTLRCDNYESTAQSTGTAKIILNEDGTGYAASIGSEISYDVSWRNGKVFLGSESLVYTLRGNKLTLKPADYQTMPVYMELILVKQ